MTAFNPNQARPARRLAWLPAALFGAGLLGLLASYPPFHVVRLSPAGAISAGAALSPGVFDPAAFADHFWEKDLPAAVARATPAGELMEALDRGPKATTERYARRVGLGGVAYYFLAGEARVLRADPKLLLLAVGGSDKPAVLIAVGPVFGNAVRDGTGLLDMNTFPGSAEFNALSAELNLRVERRVLPLLRGKISVGQRLWFAGCAEISGIEGDPRPFTLVPVQLELR